MDEIKLKSTSSNNNAFFFFLFTSTMAYFISFSHHTLLCLHKYNWHLIHARTLFKRKNILLNNYGWSSISLNLYI